MSSRNHEARVRRAAARLGLVLVRSRSRSPEDPTYHSYALADPDLGAWVFEGTRQGFGLTLDQIEARLAELAVAG